MSPSSPADVNYWFDQRCARAFWRQNEIRPYRELLDHTAAWLDPAPRERWLDLGCGCGKLTQLLWEKSQGRLASVVALDCADANAAALARVRTSFTPVVPEEKIVFRQADFSAGLGDLATGSLDGAVSGLAIQYAQHWSHREARWTTQAYDHLLAEVFRVLRPGGRFVFSVNVPDPAWLRVAFQGLPAFLTSRKPLHFLRKSLRMMRYGSWLKREANRGRFHYLKNDVVHAKLADAGFVEIAHRMSYAQQAYLFRACKPDASAPLAVPRFERESSLALRA